MPENIGGNWKRNLRAIPDRIAQKVQRAAKSDLVVACTRKIALSDIKAGTYAHLGIAHVNEAVTFPEAPVLPSTAVGKYSKRNIEGFEHVRRDLPKVWKSFTVETPNWGDWSYGSHDTTFTREVYVREFEAPRFFDIAIELLAQEGNADERVFVVKFQINAVVRPGSTGFDHELLYALNVLQENVGAVDIYPADASREDYLKTVYVAWEILPPGEDGATVAKIISRFKRPSEEVKKRLEERYALLSGLQPIAYVTGTSGFQRYFGAQFADDLVVFENLEYGNALYVMFEDWKTLSQQSRLDLLRGDTSKFIRIVHSQGWETRLTDVVKQRPEAA